VHFAAAGVVAGHYDVVVAGGVESMSRVPMGSSLAGGGRPFPEDFVTRYEGAIPNQGIGAEMIAEQWGFDRTTLDEFSLGSHEKAAAAQDSGAFDDQIVAIDFHDGSENRAVLKDEGIRRGTPMEKMAQLKPAFKETRVIHALKLEDIGVFEVNEAFAPVPLAWLQDIGADEKKLNPNGGAIALGHPLGASGARIMTTMLYRMRDKGIRCGLQTMCEGGGQANATILELL
jgi:acetyl-CoA acyltransferase